MIAVPDDTPAADFRHFETDIDPAMVDVG